jgi:hypothetical protein
MKIENKRNAAKERLLERASLKHPTAKIFHSRSDASVSRHSAASSRRSGYEICLANRWRQCYPFEDKKKEWRGRREIE